jgi:eukaryotic-like serine/threonine-protein kinase
VEARAPSRPAPPLTSDVDLSRYEIERKLGEGGAGAVFLARDRETGDRVALKKLFRMDAKSVLRLKREFRSLVDIAHPNIVKLYDMGRASDSWFLTMEYLEGAELATYLEPPEAATPDAIEADNRRLLSAFQQLARAVHALHQGGMLHRDLKPSNVLVVGERVVVLDFGLVRNPRPST